MGALSAIRESVSDGGDRRRRAAKGKTVISLLMKSCEIGTRPFHSSGKRSAILSREKVSMTARDVVLRVPKVSLEFVGKSDSISSFCFVRRNQYSAEIYR